MIVYVCPDLIFASKIASSAKALGIASRPARDATMLADRLNRVDDGKTNEPVTGVIVDLAMESAISLIEQAKQHGASLPVVAYGSHVLTDRLEQARLAGADEVLTNGLFVRRLPEILLSLKP